MTKNEVETAIKTAKLIGSENGRISHGQTEYRELYRLPNGQYLSVTCDQSQNHAVVAWKTTKTKPTIWR